MRESIGAKQFVLDLGRIDSRTQVWAATTKDHGNGYKAVTGPGGRGYERIARTAIGIPLSLCSLEAYPPRPDSLARGPLALPKARPARGPLEFRWGKITALTTAGTSVWEWRRSSAALRCRSRSPGRQRSQSWKYEKSLMRRPDTRLFAC